jgi:AraC-like DNA-binding protein
MAVDVLGEILTTLELSSQIYFRAELGAPFAIAVPAEPGVIRFHVAARGTCHIRVDEHEPVALSPGDLALVPHGAAHVLSDAPDRPATPLVDVFEASRFDGSGPLRYGGSGESTVLACGHFAFVESILHPIPASLPPLMLLRSDESTSYAWMEQVIRILEGETRTRRIGYSEVVRRLSEIMLVEVLRAYADRGELGSLAALADPQLGRALAALHAEPHSDWSLDALAHIAGLSRTVFVERFRERMGVAPMKYLAAWRMQKARRLLTRADCSVAEAARRVGYASESAFNAAFREHFGSSPGRFRRARGDA